MHFRLAVFVYCRLYGFPTDPLRREQLGTRWAISNNTGTVALGTEEQMDTLLDYLDLTVSGEREKAQTLQEESNALVEKLRSLSGKVSLEIAERGLHGRCSMVTFF